MPHILAPHHGASAMPQRPYARSTSPAVVLRRRSSWADLCVVSVTLQQERSSRGNPFRDSDVVLGRVGTDVAGAQAWIEANAVPLPRAGRGPMNLRLHVHLQRFITVTSLGVGLVTFGGAALAQEDIAPTINADGSSGRSDAGINPAVDADGPTLVYGDIPGGHGDRPGHGGSGSGTSRRGLCAAARDDRRYHGEQRRRGGHSDPAMPRPRRGR